MRITAAAATLLCVAAVAATLSAGVLARGAAAPRRPGLSGPAGIAPDADAYAGSAACQRCHADVYARWTRTRMANVVRDPKTHPDAIIPDLSQPDPLLTFSKDDIAFVYGSRWKQRYFTKRGNDYYPLPAQWDIAHKKWLKYFVPPANGDWWAAHYPADNMQRPTGPLCDGCHSVNYDVAKNAPSEWNVGCERCHGPGAAHVANPSRANIYNQARAVPARASDVCISCHSQGQPLTNPIAGRYYDWAVGYRPGLDLDKYWRLEEHTPGETNFTHYADGTAHKNRMQGNDFVQSVMFRRGVSCESCHDVHGTNNVADLKAPPEKLCLQCHGPGSENGPRTKTIEQHTHHRADSPGSVCVNCHMPKIEQTLGDQMVRSHTFRFIPPSETDRLKVPNPCTLCHTDRTTAWATEALKSWPEFSPWRVGE